MKSKQPILNPRPSTKLVGLLLGIGTSFILGCGDQLGVEVSTETETQALSPQGPYNAVRAQVFMRTLRKSYLNYIQSNPDGFEFYTHTSQTCYAMRAATHPDGYADAWHVYCIDSANRDQTKYALMIMFKGTQSLGELCNQAFSPTENIVHFPWDKDNEESVVFTLEDWVNRVRETSDFVTEEIQTFQNMGFSATDPVIFTGHSKGGAVATIYGLARATITDGNDWLEPDASLRYTTSIAFNAPKVTENEGLAAYYQAIAQNYGDRYKAAFANRQGDPVPYLPPSWPEPEDYMSSRYVAGAASGELNQHQFVLWTGEEMGQIAIQLEVDPWGGTLVDDINTGYPRLPDTTCPDSPG